MFHLDGDDKRTRLCERIKERKREEGKNDDELDQTNAIVERKIFTSENLISEIDAIP